MNTIQKLYIRSIVFLFLFLFFADMIYSESIKFFIIFNIIPIIVFYLYGSFLIGFIIQWIIFLNVNPYPIENDNKFSIMNYIPNKYIPTQHFILDKCNLKELEYPIIIKPTICSGNSRGVYIVNDYIECIKIINSNNIDPKSYMTQTFLEDYSLEVGILYQKYPWDKSGRIVEICEKKNNENINYIVDRNNIISDKLNNIINDISNKIPNFYVGRYDIRYKTEKDLLNGDFKILEVNGTMGMNFLCNNLSFNCFLVDFYWFLDRILIGLYNMFSLNGYSPISLIICMYKSLKSCIICRDWENLFSLYS